MFTFKLVSRLRTALVSAIITRNKGTATDPVQQLFLDKIREYRKKSVDGKFVDPSPAILKELQNEMEKLDKQYGAGPGVDMQAFPAFKFEEPKLDPIDETVPVKKDEGKKRKIPVKKKKAVKKTGRAKKTDPKKK